MLHVQSYIKDNLDFLNKCSRSCEENTVLVTFDVVSLYTSIPHKYGLEAISYWIETYPLTLHNRFSKEFILEGIKIILENNNCTFNDEFYHQISGTAMGTIFAPTYASLTMGYFELKLYNICELKWGTNFSESLKENWRRFLDDCETNLDKTIVTPEVLLETLNSLHPAIQFTMEYSENEVPFLDILIKKQNANIWMDLFHKSTDTRRCLPFASNHPAHCKRNIPFSLARRICTIVENHERKLIHLDELRKNLAKYQYPKTVIEFGIQKALSIPQNELRKEKTKSSENVISFISTHNPNNPNVMPLIKSSFFTLIANKVKGFKPDIKLIHSKRQAPNLKKILTKAEFTNIRARVKQCGDPRCECCDVLLLSDRYTFKNTQKTFILKTEMSCDSANLVYVAICSTCKEEYIGETGVGKTKLRDRVRVYRQHIRQPEYQQLKVEEHLRNCGKGSFKIFPFLQIRSDNLELRKSYEYKFQREFKTSLNFL